MSGEDPFYPLCAAAAAPGALSVSSLATVAALAALDPQLWQGALTAPPSPTLPSRRLFSPSGHARRAGGRHRGAGAARSGGAEP